MRYNNLSTNPTSIEKGGGSFSDLCLVDDLVKVLAITPLSNGLRGSVCTVNEVPVESNGNVIKAVLLKVAYYVVLRTNDQLMSSHVTSFTSAFFSSFFFLYLLNNSKPMFSLTMNTTDNE